jgi:hypothetical protein
MKPFAFIVASAATLASSVYSGPTGPQGAGTGIDQNSVLVPNLSFRLADGEDTGPARQRAGPSR